MADCSLLSLLKLQLFSHLPLEVAVKAQPFPQDCYSVFKVIQGSSHASKVHSNESTAQEQQFKNGKEGSIKLVKKEN